MLVFVFSRAAWRFQVHLGRWSLGAIAAVGF